MDDDQLEKFYLGLFIAAFVFCAAVVAARGAEADIPPSCHRDFASRRCADDLWRQQQLEHLLDDQRFWIDNDARIRRDDAEYEAWFYRNYISPHRYDDETPR